MLKKKETLNKKETIDLKKRFAEILKDPSDHRRIIKLRYLLLEMESLPRIEPYDNLKYGVEVVEVVGGEEFRRIERKLEGKDLERFNRALKILNHESLFKKLLRKITFWRKD